MKSRDLSKLILGTVQFGLEYGINNKRGQVVKEQAYRILKLAQQRGISSLDTAAAYGSSEQVIGNYIRDYKVVKDELKIISKLDLNEGCNLSESLENSLLRLGRYEIDTLLFHCYQDYINHKTELSQLRTFQDEGIISRIGVSVYSNDEIIKLIDEPEINVIQTPFNLLDNENIRGKTYKLLKDAGKTVHVRSVFLQGLFFMNVKKFPLNLYPLRPFVEHLQHLSLENNISMERLALEYALSKEYLDGVLFGVDSESQLISNLDSLSYSIDTKLLEEIDCIEVRDTKLLNPSNWNLTR